jgi:hypothetical protein
MYLARYRCIQSINSNCMPSVLIEGRCARFRGYSLWICSENISPLK